GGAQIVVVDGLGHGPEAAAAAKEAIRVSQAQLALAPAAVIEQAHEALQVTRGAAMAVVKIDRPKQVMSFAGIGNISCSVLTSSGWRSLASYNGIVGHQIRKIQEFTAPWEETALLVMHSDGLKSHWSLDMYPGLAMKPPSLVAGVLYRDYVRGRD